MLQTLKDPLSGEDLISARRASGVVVKPDGRVAFMIEVPPGHEAAGEDLRQRAAAAVAKIEGVAKVTAVLTTHDGPGASAASPPKAAAPKGDVGGSRLQVETKSAPRGVRLNADAVAGATPQPAQNLALPPGIKAIVAVGSAKGGVGKSTVAVNLAVAMARLGRRVGILDADIYGPSVPRLLGLSGADPQKTSGGKIAPLEAWGVFAMSIGFMVDDDAPLIWRGPIVTGALMQFLNDVDWTAGTASGEPEALDVLVLDMPPGTGDIQLTIVQRIPIAGAVIVSTPQEVALADVRRGLAMFKKTAAPVLGIVENMAWFEDANGQKVYMFGQGGAERTATESGVPFLGALPLIPDIGTTSDAGRPIAATAPDSAAGRYFEELAVKVLEGIATGVGMKPPPLISFVD